MNRAEGRTGELLSAREVVGEREKLLCNFRLEAT
jgi:hypothetical protein